MDSSKISLKEGFDFLFEDDEIKKEKVTKFNIEYNNKDIDTNSASNKIAFILALDIASAAINKSSDTILTKNFYSSSPDDKDSFFIAKTLDFSKLAVATKNASSFSSVFGITADNQNKSVQILFEKYKECINDLKNSNISGILLSESESEPVRISLQRYTKMIMVLKNTAALPKDNRGNKINFKILFDKIIEHIDSGRLFKQGVDINQEFEELSDHEKLLYGFQEYLKTLSRYQKQNIRMNAIKTFMSELSDGEKNIKAIYSDFVGKMGSRTSGKMKRAIKDLTKDLISADGPEELETAVADASSVAEEEADSKEEISQEDQSQKLEYDKIDVISANSKISSVKKFAITSAFLLACIEIESSENKNYIDNIITKSASFSGLFKNISLIIHPDIASGPWGTSLFGILGDAKSDLEKFNVDLKISLLEALYGKKEDGNYKIDKNELISLLDKVRSRYESFTKSSEVFKAILDNVEEPDIDEGKEKLEDITKTFNDLKSYYELVISKISNINSKDDFDKFTSKNYEKGDITFGKSMEFLYNFLEILEKEVSITKEDPMYKSVESFIENITKQTSQKKDEFSNDEEIRGTFAQIFSKISENQKININKDRNVGITFSPSIKINFAKEFETVVLDIVDLHIEKHSNENDYILIAEVVDDDDISKEITWENLLSHDKIPNRLISALKEAFASEEAGEEEKGDKDDIVIETALKAPTNYNEFMKQVVVYSSVAIRINNKFPLLWVKKEYTIAEIVNLFEKEIPSLAEKMGDKSQSMLNQSINNFKSYGEKQIDKLLVEEDNQEKVSIKIKMDGPDSLRNCAARLANRLEKELGDDESLKPNLLTQSYDLMDRHKIQPEFKLVKNGKEINTSVIQAQRVLHESKSVSYKREENIITVSADGVAVVEINIIAKTVSVVGAEQNESTVISNVALTKNPLGVAKSLNISDSDTSSFIKDISSIDSERIAQETGGDEGLIEDIINTVGSVDDSVTEYSGSTELSFEQFRAILNNSFERIYPKPNSILDKFKEDSSASNDFANEEKFKAFMTKNVLDKKYTPVALASMLPPPKIDRIREFLKDSYRDEMKSVFDALYSTESKFDEKAFVTAYTRLITDATYRAIGKGNSNDRVTEMLGEGLFDIIKAAGKAGKNWIKPLGKGMGIMMGAKALIVVLGGAALINPIIATLGLMGIMSSLKNIVDFNKAKAQYANNPLKYIEETVFNDKSARSVIAKLVKHAIASQICDILEGKVRKSKLDMQKLSLKNVQASNDKHLDYWSSLDSEKKASLKKLNDQFLKKLKSTNLYNENIINESTINILFNELCLKEENDISDINGLVLDVINKSTSFKANFIDWTENEVRVGTSSKSATSRFQIEYRDEIKDKKQLFISPDQISKDYTNYLFSKAFGVFLEEEQKSDGVDESAVVQQEGLYFDPNFAIKGSLSKLLFEDSKIILNEQSEEDEPSSDSASKDLSNYVKTMMCLAANSSAVNSAQMQVAPDFDLLSAVKSVLIPEAHGETGNSALLQLKNIDISNIDKIYLSEKQYFKEIIAAKVKLLTADKEIIEYFLETQDQSGDFISQVNNYSGYEEGALEGPSFLNDLNGHLYTYVKWLEAHSLKKSGSNWKILKLASEPDNSIPDPILNMPKWSNASTGDEIIVHKNIINKIMDFKTGTSVSNTEGKINNDELVIALKKMEAIENSSLSAEGKEELANLAVNNFVSGKSSIPDTETTEALLKVAKSVDPEAKVSDVFNEQDLQAINDLNNKLGLPEMESEFPLKDFTEAIAKASADAGNANDDSLSKLAAKFVEVASQDNVDKIKGTVPFFKSFSNAMTKQSTSSVDTGSTDIVAGAKFGYVSSPAEAVQYQEMHFDPIIKEILIEEGGRQKILQFFMSSQESLHGKAKALGCVKIDLEKGTSEFMGSGPSFQTNYVEGSGNSEYLERLGVVFEGGDGTGKLPELVDGGPARELSPDDILAKKGLKIVLSSLKGSVKQVYDASETAVKKIALKSALQSDAEFSADALGEESNFSNLGKFMFKQWSAQKIIGSDIGQNMKIEGPTDVLKLVFKNANSRIEELEDGPEAIRKFLTDPDIARLNREIIDVKSQIDEVGMGSTDDIGITQDDSFFGKIFSNINISMPGEPEDAFDASPEEVAEVDNLMAKYFSLQKQMNEALDESFDENVGRLGKPIMKAVAQSIVGDAKSQGYNPLYKSLVKDIAQKTGKSEEEIVSQVKEADVQNISNPANNDATATIQNDADMANQISDEQVSALKTGVKEVLASSEDASIKDLSGNIVDDASLKALESSENAEEFVEIFNNELSKKLDLSGGDTESVEVAKETVAKVVAKAATSDGTSSAAAAASDGPTFDIFGGFLNDPNKFIDSSTSGALAGAGIFIKICSKFFTRGIKGGEFAKKFFVAAKPERAFASMVIAALSTDNAFNNVYGSNRKDQITKAVKDFESGVNPSLIKFKYNPQQEDSALSLNTINQVSQLAPAAGSSNEQFVYKTSISNFLFENIVTKRSEVSQNANRNSYQKEINNHNNLMKEFKNFFK